MNAKEAKINEGVEKDEMCNREGCIGIIAEHDTETSCSCHINPPCSHCETDRCYCPVCGYSGGEKQKAAIKNSSDAITHKQREQWNAENKRWAEQRDLFYKKYRGEVPVEKLEIRIETHTHFSQKVIGIFPIGTENYASLYSKVKGTFGGRWNCHINETSYRFEFIAYTD